jgi:hypothetical protein
MSLSSDLLELAEELARLDPTRPRQAALRRAVSTAYYALFHLLIEEAMAHVAGGAHDGELRSYLARRPSHGGIKAVCKELAQQKWPSDGKRWQGISAILKTPDQGLINVASAFVTLQERRHAADYDPAQVLTRAEVILDVNRARAAFTDWQNLSVSPQRSFFLFLIASDTARRPED